MRLPLVSIIIPVYNVEPYIADCLHSVMRQTYQGQIECIIVDDCGADNSMAIAEQFVDEYKGPIVFRILHHDYNRGLSAARNTGMDAARGEYFFFLDSDDWISDDCIEVLTRPLEERDYDMVLGNYELTYNPHDIHLLAKGTGAVLGNENIFKEFYAERTLYVTPTNKLFHSCLLRRCDLAFLEGQIHEDDLWSYKTTLCLESLYVQNRITYFYRIRPGAITSDYHSRTKLRLRSWMATVDYILNHPAKVRKEYYDKCVVYNFGKVVRFMIHDKDSHRAEFVALRKRFDYHPFKLFLKGELGFLQLKTQLYLALPPHLGYSYIELRKIGRRLFRKKTTSTS